MIPPLPETDLLAFIEGELPSERLSEVQEALRADPELRRLVESLRADRALIRASLNHAESAAPRGIVAEALAEAERLPPAKPAPVPAAPAQPAPRLRIAPVLSLLAAAAITVLAIVVFWPAPTSNDRFASAPAGPPAPGEAFTVAGGGPEYVFEAAPRKSRDDAAPALPGVFDRRDDRPLEFSPIQSRPGATPPVRTREQAARDAARDQELAKLFGLPPGGTDAPIDFDQQLADAARNGWGPGIEVGGMDLGRAAELAMTRRLRIVVESRNAAALRAGAGGFMRVERGPDGALAASDGPIDAISVTFPMDTEMEGLQNALARVAESIESEGDAVVRFEEVPADEEFAQAARVAPSTEFDDVVWWRLPSDRWLISSSVTVPIEFVEPEPAGP